MSLISTTTDRRIILAEVIADAKSAKARIIADALDAEGNEGRSISQIIEYDFFTRDLLVWYDKLIVNARREIASL